MLLKTQLLAVKYDAEDNNDGSRDGGGESESEEYEDVEEVVDDIAEESGGDDDDDEDGDEEEDEEEEEDAIDNDDIQRQSSDEEVDEDPEDEANNHEDDSDDENGAEHEDEADIPPTGTTEKAATTSNQTAINTPQSQPAAAPQNELSGPDLRDEENERIMDMIEELQTPAKRRKLEKGIISSSSRRIKKEVAEFVKTATLDGADGYFDQHAQKPALSTHSLSKLPAISSQEYVLAVKQSDLAFEEQREIIAQAHENIFSQLAFELSQGFNLILHGLGSKRELVMDFVDEYLDDVDILVVNGYNPSTTIREVLASAAPFLVDDSKLANALPKAPSEALAVIMSSSSTTTPFPYNSYRPKLVIVIHNIDGEPFRNSKTQAILSQLATHSAVSMLATVDHINAPMLWDSAKLSLFRFIWHDATTFASYTVETSFEDPLLLGGGSGAAAATNSATQGSGIRFVLESLTSNARGLYRVLISNQLQAIEDSAADPSSSAAAAGPARFGIESKILYQQCSEEFIVTNELNFRTMLTEFYEHEMLVSTKDQLGTEVIYSPFDKETLERLLEDDILNQ